MQRNTHRTLQRNSLYDYRYDTNDEYDEYDEYDECDEYDEYDESTWRH
jgi:hypothetical protein